VTCFFNASPVVQAVMIGLALASAATWSVWLAKTIELASVKRSLRALSNGHWPSVGLRGRPSLGTVPSLTTTRPAMNGLHSPQTWRCRVADLLDDPVAQAVLRRDGLSRDDVFAELAPVADALERRKHRRRTSGPWAFAEDLESCVN